jgi:hypothetical protein
MSSASEGAPRRNSDRDIPKFLKSTGTMVHDMPPRR